MGFPNYLRAVRHGVGAYASLPILDFGTYGHKFIASVFRIIEPCFVYHSRELSALVRPELAMEMSFGMAQRARVSKYEYELRLRQN